MVVGFGAGIITARILGPRDRGLFALLILLPQTHVTFAKVGVARAHVCYVRRAQEPVATVAASSLVLTSVVSLVLLATCWLAEYRSSTPSPTERRGPTVAGARPRAVPVDRELLHDGPAGGRRLRRLQRAGDSAMMLPGILLSEFVRESASSVRDMVLVKADDLARYARLVSVAGARVWRSGTAAK